MTQPKKPRSKKEEPLKEEEIEAPLKEEIVQPEAEVKVKEEKNLIAPELRRLEATIAKIQDAADSIDPISEEDPEVRIKLILGLQKVAEGQPKLLMALEELRNKHKLKKEDVKGNKSLSPLEDGTLDDEDEDDD